MKREVTSESIVEFIESDALETLYITTRLSMRGPTQRIMQLPKARRNIMRTPTRLYSCEEKLLPLPRRGSVDDPRAGGGVGGGMGGGLAPPFFFSFNALSRASRGSTT